jgi:hypothetical protein
MKQAAGSRRVSSQHLHPLISFETQNDKPPPLGFEAQTKKLSWWFWNPNHQTVDLVFQPQTKKLSHWSWGQTTNKPSPPVLRLNRKPHASRLLHMYNADHTRYHPTSRSSGHRVPNLCLIISDPLHQVSYSCLNPRHYLPCCTRHLHITRQATMFLQTKFKFKLNQVNYSSHK